MVNLNFEWAVVGAGPAGIAAVGKLLDYGVTPSQILWVDPFFEVGDFGEKWPSVPSNTKVNLFIQFLMACRSFNFESNQNRFELMRLDANDTCELHYMASPLQWISDNLYKKVHTIKAYVEQLELKQQRWHLTINDQKLCADRVILAIGAEPKSLNHDVDVIALRDALDISRLQQCVTEQDQIAVFGSSHSAILVLRNLLTKTDAKVVNFYLEPLRYAIHFDDWILFDDSGLKGRTAEWARKNIDGEISPKMQRIYASRDNIDQYLPKCNKAVYAVGFERRHIAVKGMPKLTYLDHCGIIAPGLFGLGIAFPQAHRDRIGNKEYRVGLWKFVEYVTEVMPYWFAYGP